jgi:hypothetical protein
MQDLIQDYASDLRKLRDMFHQELLACADELSKAMGVYAHRSEAALASFMENASARGFELEVSATARLSQFCGLPANGGQPEVDDKPVTHPPTNANMLRIVTAAEQADADSLRVESESNRKPRLAARLSEIGRDRPLEIFHLPLQEESVEIATESPAS